jgi:glutamate 5-kinase
VVVKVGSSTLVDDDGRPRLPVFERLAGECAELVSGGVPVVVVSSGAVALGLGELGKAIRPRAMGDLQAASALGQTLLQSHWQTAFTALGVRAGQVLLTEPDIHRRSSYVNARRTLRRLMSWGVVPVVNENDSTATDEITFGDNDALAAHVALMLQARLLVLLTDIDGVYDRDPASAGARLIPEILDAAQVDALEELVAAIDGRLHEFPAYRQLDVRLHVGLAEMTGRNSLQPLICRRIDASQASPPRSSLWSNQTSIPACSSALAILRAASAS